MTWKKETARHSMARKFGKAPPYKNKKNYPLQSPKQTIPTLPSQPFNDTDIQALYHSTSPKNAKEILKTGFRLSSNPAVTSGIYTIDHYDPDWFQEASTKPRVILKINIDGSAKYVYNGAERPMDAMRGMGFKEYSIMWATLMARANPKYTFLIEEAKKVNGMDWGKESKQWRKASDDLASVDVKDQDLRYKFEKMHTAELRRQGIDIYQNGGEVIILNPKAIKSVNIYSRI